MMRHYRGQIASRVFFSSNCLHAFIPVLFRIKGFLRRSEGFLRVDESAGSFKCSQFCPFCFLFDSCFSAWEFEEGGGGSIAFSEVGDFADVPAPAAPLDLPFELRVVAPGWSFCGVPFVVPERSSPL